MAAIIHECPHCGAEKMGFQLLTQVEDREALSKSSTSRFRAVMTCAGCPELLIGIFLKTHASNFRSPMDTPGDPREVGFTLERVYPQLAPSKCPDHTPDGLKRIFLQAANASKRGDPDASGAMSRKVVDNSTQLLLKEKTKDYRTIYDRIEALASNGTLTPDLAKWAHEVRLGGADAAHDLDPFTPEEADELLDFAELYLIYVYSLPERLRLRREKAAKEKEKAGGSN
jgi:hypothetical protein